MTVGYYETQLGGGGGNAISRPIGPEQVGVPGDVAPKRNENLEFYSYVPKNGPRSTLVMYF